MHLFIILFAVLCAYKLGDWKNYRKYPLFFMSFINLLYQYLFQSNLLWQFQSDFMASEKIVELGYTLICYPCAILIYLTRMPDAFKKRVMYLLKWIAVFVIIEYILYITGRFKYYHPWNIWYSAGFNFIMFPTILLNYKKPLYSYLVIFVCAVLALNFFKITI